MPPKGKSSASSATRKKHARKAATTIDVVQEPQMPSEKKARGKDKKSKKEPRKKVYIPPVKPAPVQPDPLDTLGLVQKLPPELVVVLRLLSKKDAISKRRALEDLQSAWLGRVIRGVEDEYLVQTLQETIPVWLHRLPTLLMHPSRRIRLQACGLHFSFLQIPTLRAQIFFHLREAVSDDQAESILGSWCLAVHDSDRLVSMNARESWNSYVSVTNDSGDKLVLDETLLPRLWDFVQRTLLDPTGVYLCINPPQSVAVTLTPNRKGSGPGAPTRKEEEPTRTKVDEEEENEQDRKARLRAGAFGATEWVLCAHFANAVDTSSNELITAFANPALWSSLYHGRKPPFVEFEGFGFEQPVVRRSAWSLLQTLLQKGKGHLGHLLPILSRAVLRSAWVEPDPNVRAEMWQPLLTFLQHFPQSWGLEAEKNVDDEESGSDSEDDTIRVAPSAAVLTRPSQAYTEFLQFLATGCSGSPVQAYPIVLVILSTIPSPIFSASSSHPLEELFASFWAAVDARVLNSLDRMAASTAFLSSLLECMVLMVRRVLLAPPEEATSLAQGRSGEDRSDIIDVLKALVKNEIGRTWEELSSGGLKVQGKDAGSKLAKTFSALHTLRPDLFDVAWSVTVKGVHSSLAADQKVNPYLVPELLRQLTSSLEKESVPGNSAHELVLSVVGFVLNQCASALEAEEVKEAHFASLVGILDTFGDLVFSDTGIVKAADELVQGQTHRLLTRMSALLILYLEHRADEAACSTVWHQVLEDIASHPDEIDMRLTSLLDATEHGSLPAYLRPQREELHDVAGHLLTQALSDPGNEDRVSLIRRLLHSYEHFISSSCRENLLRGIVDAFVFHFDSVLHDESPSLDAFTAPLNLLHGLAGQDAPLGTLTTSLFPQVTFPYIFLFTFLLPQIFIVDDKQQETARALWDHWFISASDEAKISTLATIKHLLRELLTDCVARPTPEQLVRTLSASPLSADVNLLSEIFPSRAGLDSMLDDIPPTPLDSSLAVVDPLVPPPLQYRSAKGTSSEYDPQGLAQYARIVHGLLFYLVDDRQTARQNAWALHHFFALVISAEEFLCLPSAESPMFSHSVASSVLRNIQDKTQQLAAYLFSSTIEEQWHSSVTKALSGQASVDGLDGLGHLVVDLVNHAKRHNSVRESRILHMILRHALNTATKADAEQWILIARKIENLAPHISVAIVLSVTRYAPEPSRLDRLRNELAAGALGIPASKANTEGLWLLRNLAASAPDPESDVVFLPQARAVNFLKACQQWITSDEDLEEDVQSEMTLIFASLVPILSNVPGGHWDLMFDVIENNLENSSLDDSSTYVTLSRTLRLFLVIEDFASSNKSLKVVWEEKKSTNLTFIRDLVSVKLENEKPSTPLSACRELALQIVQDLPTSLLTRETLPKMCHLVMDSAFNVQRMAYQLLHEAAKKYTEELVIEAAVDTEGDMKPRLPAELLDIIQQSLNHEETDGYGQEWFGYLLAWMVAFDLFLDASLKVKSGYVDQLRDLGLVGERLLPVIFGVLNLYGGVTKAFKLDMWDLDEIYLDLYSPDTPISLRLLTAHLYYRALLLIPSLVRNWLVDCRDRQLSTTVASYTSRHFSPAIIRTELARVKEPNATTELSGENITIKVASAVNEVTASYTVDEQLLELTVKLPADWPLHTIEIRDSKLVGVTEDRWRAWVLGVRQILTFRSGSIVDGLSFFLKNVTSHFEGIAECAICYSVVNASDGSLPRKPCKTCHNRFHAACLFKWFNSSHSSSCPLCRSEIMTGR